VGCDQHRLHFGWGVLLWRQMPPEACWLGGDREAIKGPPGDGGDRATEAHHGLHLCHTNGLGTTWWEEASCHSLPPPGRTELQCDGC